MLGYTYRMEINLKRDSWHNRLLGWTFEDVPRFDNFCPYFWCVVFSIMVSPAMLLFKCVKWTNIGAFTGIGWALDFIFGILREHAERAVEQAARSLSDADAFDINQRICRYGSTGVFDRTTFNNAKAYRRACSIIAAWCALRPDWTMVYTRVEKESAADIERRKREDDEFQAREEARRQRRARVFGVIATYTRDLLLMPIAGAVIGVAAGLLLAICYAVIVNWHSIPWMILLDVTLGILVILAALFGVFLLISWWLDSRPMSWLKASSSNAFGIFFDYARAAKQNYCPRIKWVDKE